MLVNRRKGCGMRVEPGSGRRAAAQPGSEPLRQPLRDTPGGLSPDGSSGECVCCASLLCPCMYIPCAGHGKNYAAGEQHIVHAGVEAVLCVSPDSSLPCHMQEVADQMAWNLLVTQAWKKFCACLPIAFNHMQEVADRVILGLLPSSACGWRTALRALQPMTGGWLHLHHNVKDSEEAAWIASTQVSCFCMPAYMMLFKCQAKATFHGFAIFARDWVQRAGGRDVGTGRSM